MSDLIIRWWPKSGCTKSIATMDEDFARLTRELAESEARVETLQNRWASRPLSHPDGEALIAENTRLRGLLREGEDWRRHKASCNLYFTRETGSNLAASHCNCGFNEHEGRVDAALGSTALTVSEMEGGR